MKNCDVYNIDLIRCQWGLCGVVVVCIGGDVAVRWAVVVQGEVVVVVVKLVKGSGGDGERVCW